jgi:hypothetical protein
VIAATSSWVSEIRAAARLSLRCSTLVVPGIGSYALYRAAADRADAAQDELADAIRAAASTPNPASKP